MSTIDIDILELLLEATKRETIQWRINLEDPNLELFEGDLGDDAFEIEIIHMRRASNDATEKALARIQGRKIYQTYAAGTQGFMLLCEILSESRSPWNNWNKDDKDLRNLKSRLEKQLLEPSAGRN